MSDLFFVSASLSLCVCVCDAGIKCGERYIYIYIYDPALTERGRERWRKGEGKRCWFHINNEREQEREVAGESSGKSNTFPKFC